MHFFSLFVVCSQTTNQYIREESVSEINTTQFNAYFEFPVQVNYWRHSEENKTKLIGICDIPSRESRHLPFFTHTQYSQYALPLSEKPL